MVDLRDATRQDIVDVCSAIEQIFLFYEQGKTPYIYIINLLELLLQSARTRVCILRLPTQKSEKQFTIRQLKQHYIIFANFRDRQLYNLFCEQLTEKLNRNSAHFLSYDLVKIPAKNEDLYFCLPRISIRTNEVQINHKENPEAYSRIRQLLQTMLLEKHCWSIDLLGEIYHCFNTIPHDSNLNCPETCSNTMSTLISPDKRANNLQQVEQKAPSQYDELFSPIEEWVDYVYHHATESRLSNVAHHTDGSIIDYSNIFFFLRVNKPHTNPKIKKCDNFDVRIVIPEQQQRELSLYYHRQQKHHCQWYKDGNCGIHGMPECEFEAHWSDLPPDSKEWDEEHIYSAYKHLWQGLHDDRGSSKRTSEDAFRNNSVIFERYARHKPGNGEKGYVRIDPGARRDRLMACIRYRLLPAPDGDLPEEDNVPQVMFVPIYTGGAPFVMAATVVNANRPSQNATDMSEWRKAYRFAGMVLQFMSSRLKEAARKSYLNAAADIVEDFVHRTDNCTDQDIVSTCLAQSNQQLAVLAQAYPYQQIILKEYCRMLAKPGFLVNDKERQTITTRVQQYEILLKENNFWCHYSADKTFFTAEDVAKKFKSAQGRAALIKQAMLDEEVKNLYEERFGKQPGNSDS